MPNTPPPAPAPQDSLEAIPIDDSVMVFRSKQASDSTPTPKKFAIKKAKMKIKMRRSTPAPTLKRDGRKRLVDSPLPEDKQVCKRIDFGDDTTSSPDAPKCKAEIFPATSRHVSEAPPQAQIETVSMVEQPSLAIVCYHAPGTKEKPMAAGPDAGEGGEEDRRAAASPLHASRSTMADGSKSECVLVGEKVDIPEIECETNCLLESTLEPCQVDESHVSLAVGDLLLPKVDKLLNLASLDSADMLDVAAAPPLLAGALPKKSQPSYMHEAESFPTLDVNASPSGAILSAQVALSDEMEVQPRFALEGPEGFRGWAAPAPITACLDGEGGANLEEFPPLEKGQFTKIRNRFEAGSKLGVDGSRGSGGGSRISGSSSGMENPMGRVCYRDLGRSFGRGGRIKGQVGVQYCDGLKCAETKTKFGNADRAQGCECRR